MLGLKFKIKIKEHEEVIKVNTFPEALVSFEVELYKRNYLEKHSSVCDIVPRAMTKFKQEGTLILSDDILISLEEACLPVESKLA